MSVNLSNFNGGTAAGVRRGNKHIRELNEQNRMKRLRAEWPIDCPIHYHRDNGETVPGLIKQISVTGLSVRILGNFTEGDRLVWVAVKHVTKQPSTSQG
jgi:hypothetical protein